MSRLVAFFPAWISYWDLTGHSSKGAAAAQDHAFKSREEYAGIIVVSSTLLSQYRGQQQQGSTPFMSLNGDMDGVFKPLRSAVSYFHANMAQGNDPLMHPILLLPGLNHFSLLSGSQPPPQFEKRDLSQTVSEDQAHARLADIVSAFITVHSHLPTDTVNEARSLILDQISSSSRVLKPMVELLELEANHQLQKACDSDMPSPHCPWYAQVGYLF